MAEERRERGARPPADHGGRARRRAPARLVALRRRPSPLPFLSARGTSSAYGLFTLIYALLALGLNVDVGFAGLLDLGYIAFYGFGAYAYAILASPKYGIHWPAELAIPVVVVGAALLGLLLGLPSRRLLGDYLAIVTLFFGQAFVAFVTTRTRRASPAARTDRQRRPLNIFGFTLTTTRQYYYFTLVAFLVVIARSRSLSDRERDARGRRCARIRSLPS